MNLGSLNVSIGADVEPLKRGMATAKQAVLSLADQARISERHLAALTQQMDKEAQASQRSASATKQLTALDRELRTAKSQLNAVLAGESAAAQAVAQKYDLLTAAQRKQLTSVKEQITAQKALQEAELSTALAAEKAAAREAAARARKPSLQQVGQGIASAGMGLTAGVTVPILAGAAGVLSAGTQLDAAFDKIRVGTGASGQQLTALEGIAKRVGATVPSSFAEVGQAVAELAQRTGLTGPALENLARQTLTLNRLVGGDLTETIRENARVFADWGIVAKDQSGALDFLFRTFQQTGIHVDKLAATLVSSGAPLRQLGFSFGEAAALVGNFEKQGVRTELVLGSLRIELGRLAKAGITDAHQAFLQIIESIKGAGTASQANAMAVKAFGARAGPDMAAAIREGRFEIEKLWKSIEGGHDSIQKAAKDTDDFGEKFAVLRNRVLVALQPLGSELMKVLGQLADALIKAAPHLTRLVEWFGKLPGGAQLAVAGFAAFMAGLGPVLVGVGRFIAAWPAMVAGFGAIRAAILAVNFAALLNPITLVIAALGALTLAFVTNFHGIRDEFVTGVRVMIGVARGLSYAEAQQAAVEAGRPSAAQGEIPIGENRGSLNRVRAAQEAAAARAAATKAAADRAAAARAAAGGFDFSQFDAAKKPKETPQQKERIRFTEELTQAHERLKTLLAGEDNIAAQVATRYHLLTQAQRDNLTAVLQQIHDQQILQQSQKAYTTDMGKLNAEIRRLKAGHDAEASGIDALKEKYPGLSRAQLTAMNNAIQWRKHLAEVNAEARRVAEAVRGITLRALESAASTRAGAVAMQLFGETVLKQFPGLKTPGQVWDKLTPGQQRTAKGVAITGGEADIDAENRRLEKENRILAYRSPTNQISQQFFDKPAEQLNQAHLDQVHRMEDNRNANLQLAASNQALKASWETLQQVIGSAGANLGNLQEKTRILTTGTRDERDAFLQLGVSLGDLPKDIQQVVVASLALDRKFSESQAIIQQFTKGTEQVFGEMFHGLMEHGFKGFFQQVKQGFTQLFQNIAAQFLASKLTDLIMGKQDTAGNRSGGFWGSLFNIGMQVATGGGRGGGGAGGGDGGGVAVGPVLGPPIPAGMASIQSRTAFVPRNVSPQLAAAGAGGGGVHHHYSVIQHIAAVDARSFKQNERQVAADAGRMVQTLQRRNGR